YKLGPEDRVRVSVHEWRSARAEPYEWTALKGEFTVNATGLLSLPLNISSTLGWHAGTAR
ncbi:MAG: hypothetical protein ACJ73U_06285, partial [Actinophytocola sp.]